MPDRVLRRCGAAQRGATHDLDQKTEVDQLGAVSAFGLALPLTPAGAALADSSKLIFVKVVNGARNPALVRDVDQPGTADLS